MAHENRGRSLIVTASLVAMVVIVALIVYAQAWHHPFVFDDVLAVRDHAVVRGDVGWHAVLTAPYWPRDFTPDPLYRPATIASYRLNASIFGMNPFWFHVVNSVLHASCAVLVALTAVRLWGRVAAGLAAGVVFATHPVLAEAVVPVAGRSELLAALFVLLLLYSHLSHVVSGRGATVGHHLAVSVLYLLACTSKEHGILAIVVVAAIDLWSRRGSSRPRPAFRRWANTLAASHYVGLILAAAAFLVTRWAIFGWQTSLPPSTDNTEFNPLDAASTLEAVATPFKLLLVAVQLMVVPVGLCPIWAKGGLDLASGMLAPPVLGGMVLAIVLAVSLVATGFRGRKLFVPLAGLVVFLLIPCHFVPVANWFFAERWLYTPTAMLVIGAAGAAVVAPRFSVIAGVVIGVAFSVTAWRYQACWQSNKQIIDCVLDRQPLNYAGLREACRWYERRGRIEDAAVYIDRLVEHHADEASSWYFRAGWLVEQGRFVEAARAMDEFRRMASIPEFTLKMVQLSERIERGLEGG
jgi:hypothetical protein